MADLNNPVPESANRHKVLVLDDEWSTLERIKAILDSKYHVTLASRASEAVKLMEQQLLSRGAERCAHAGPGRPDPGHQSERRTYPETQYILMTAFSDIEDTITALAPGGGGLPAETIQRRRGAARP
jgi:CheY-like chemotaxis protein